MIYPSHGIHLTAVAIAYVTGTLAMNLLAVDVLRTRHGLARVTRVAHDLSKVKPVIVRNFAPAFATLMQCYDVIEAPV